MLNLRYTDCSIPNTIQMKVLQKQTKIVATLGPASNAPEVIAEMIKNGMNVARINFSHGDHTEHG